MLLNKSRRLAAVSLICALSVILQLLGTLISINTLFFTALAAYLIGYSVNKYELKYGAMQLVVCTLLDLFLNPDKMHWGLYLALGGYIFLSEVIFQKANHMADEKKKMRVQLIYNWILFNVIYVPLVLFFQNLFFTGELPGGIQGNSAVGLIVLWLAGQIGWIVYDKAYRIFFRTVRERNL